MTMESVGKRTISVEIKEASPDPKRIRPVSPQETKIPKNIEEKIAYLRKEVSLFTSIADEGTSYSNCQIKEIFKRTYSEKEFEQKNYGFQIPGAYNKAAFSHIPLNPNKLEIKGYDLSQLGSVKFPEELEELELNCCSHLECLNTLFSQLPSLKILKITGFEKCEIDPQFFPKSLSDLQLDYISAIDPLLETLPDSVEKLRLSKIYSVFISDKLSKHLKNLYLEGTGQFFVPKLPSSLQYLNLIGFDSYHQCEDFPTQVQISYKKF